MDLKQEALAEIDATRTFFDRSTSALAEEDSTFRATPETMTVAAMVAHVAQTIDWLRAGALDDDWRLDFEAQFEETNRVESLAAARRRLDEAWGRLRARIEGMSAAELGAPMADNPILQTRPRSYGIGAVVDHTGHHRGSLAVFARLLGKVPPNPYMAEEAAQLPM
ncbi:MAG: DinB family protein [Acidobacteria bacterium]|nr:DinB family protein [Acidobacteriota bacterium]MCB9378357.1 DinB family protein [Holophagales bacterium]